MNADTDGEDLDPMLEFCMDEADVFLSLVKQIELQIPNAESSAEARRLAQELMAALKRKIKHYRHIADTQKLYNGRSAYEQEFCSAVAKAGSKVTVHSNTNPKNRDWTDQLYAFAVDVRFYLDTIRKRIVDARNSGGVAGDRLR